MIGTTVVTVGEVRKQEQALLIRAACVVDPRSVHWPCNHDGKGCCLFLTGAVSAALDVEPQDVLL